MCSQAIDSLLRISDISTTPWAYAAYHVYNTLLPQGAVTGAVIGLVTASVFGIGNASLHSYTEKLNSTGQLCALYNMTVLEDTKAATGY